MKSIKVLLSGIAVYFIVAMLHACGGSVPMASTGTTSVASGGGGGNVGGAGGAGGAKSTASASGAGGMGGMMNPVGDALADSGSRIKAQWIVGEDGSKQFAGFYDSQRKEECFFYGMYDGNRHCIPLALASANYAGYYADAMCTVLISALYVSTCPKASPYAYSIPGGLCKSEYKIFQSGAKIAPVTVYHVSGASCVSSAPDPSYEYHLIGPEIPPSDFVLGTLTIDP